VAPGEPPAARFEDDFVTLEGHQDGRAVPVSLRYSLIREISDLLTQPEAAGTGLLCGLYSADAIALEGYAVKPAAADAIGIFRAQVGGWAAVDRSDREALQNAGMEHGVVMVLRTLSQGPWSATLFWVEADLRGSETPLAEFPWDEYLLRKGWLLDFAPPAARQPQPDAGLRRWDLMRRAMVPALLLLIAAVASRWLHRPMERPPAASANSSAPPLALRVAQAGEDFEISWSHNSDAVRQAIAGSLTIRNGLATRVLAMRPEQLREGRLVYRPLSGVDAEIRLEVMDGGGKSQAESVQVLGFDAAAAMKPAPLAEAPSDGSKAVRQAPDFEGTRHESPARAAPLSNLRSQAVAIHRAGPKISPDVRKELRAAKGEVTVSVLVSIDAAGAVDHALVVGSTGEPSFNGPYIRLAALNAARQWRFQPAMADGRPAPSKMTLTIPF
jgi:protein TonB